MASEDSETPQIPPNWRVRRTEAVTTSDLGDEVVVLDLAKGRYFGLEEVGALVWQLLETNTTVSEIERAIMAEYEVPPEQCRRDLQELLAQLSSRGLIQAEAPEGDP